MNVFGSPARRGVAVAAVSISLLVTACGSDTEGDGAEGASAEDADSTDNEERERAPSLAEPGILAVQCNGGGEVIASLYSDEDAAEIAHHSFTNHDFTGAEVPGFPAGRATDSESVILPVCSNESTDALADARQYLIPEYDALLVTVQEEVEGTEVETVGVLDAEGNVSVLTEEQDLGDFDEPTTFKTPRYDATQDRILYLELEPGSEDTEIGFVAENPTGTGRFHQVDLGSGETTEAYDCSIECGTLWIDQDNGLLSWVDNAYENISGVLMSPDGSIAVHRDSNSFWSVDNPTEVTVVSTDMEEPVEGEDMLDLADAYFEGDLESNKEIVAFVSETELVLSDNALSVVEVGESEIGNIDEDPDESFPTIPEVRTLVPEGPRTNGTPAISPDLDEAVFLSMTDSGAASWYRVPTDGSTEPTEIGPITIDEDSVLNFVPISWT